MRFFIDFDTGDEIRGWVVPDNPLAVSRVVVAVDGERRAELPANIVNETFKQNGWHSTGQCAFQLSGVEIPGLADAPRLELYDADTNLLVHRRVPPTGLVNQQLMLLNTSIKPETTIQGALFPHFQQSYFNLHRLSDEMMVSVFGIRKPVPVFLSGNVIVPRYEQYFIPEMMLSAILLHDPHVEMATRMLWLKARGPAADASNRWRMGRYGEAAVFAADYDFTDMRSLKRFFRMLPEPAYHLLYNPLARQLGTRLPDDRLHPGNSIVAIEILARLGIVGHRDYFEAFVSTLFDRLGLDAALPTPEPIPAEALALAERLRSVRAVEEMLVFDVAMAEAVVSSVAKSWAR